MLFTLGSADAAMKLSPTLLDRQLVGQFGSAMLIWQVLVNDRKLIDLQIVSRVHNWAQSDHIGIVKISKATCPVYITSFCFSITINSPLDITKNRNIANMSAHIAKIFS